MNVPLSQVLSIRAHLWLLVVLGNTSHRWRCSLVGSSSLLLVIGAGGILQRLLVIVGVVPSGQYQCSCVVQVVLVAARCPR